MNALIAFSLKHRLLMLGLFIGVMPAGGLIAFRQLNIEAYPDPVPPQVVIITQNPGPVRRGDRALCHHPVEVAMAGLRNLTSVRSTSLSACPM